ncbi:aminoacyl-tRNA hydrolase [Candidatus Uhrbacteria bacterium]|nr:aminoacyl-tRNA hydrolase [Candidatus Uhrbacteria bacterium]
MKLFVGLGNPGKTYEKTRHNAGCMALETFVYAAEGHSDFFLISREKHMAYEAVEYEWRRGNAHDAVLCVWPHLFMNRSGEVMRQIVCSHKKMAVSADLVVLHDDIDIPIGMFKVDKNSSSGGHKGVQNIIDQLGTKDFIRFRIGIKPIHASRLATEDFVLKKFSKEEEQALKKVYQTVCGALMVFLEQGLSGTQNIYNKKMIS